MSWSEGLPEGMQALLRRARPTWTPPMLATPGKDADEDWVYERKLDGFRIQAVCDGTLRIYTRNGRERTRRFPTTGLPRRAMVLDGEAVAFEDGKENFGRVQRGQATHLVFFDVLNLDGIDVRALPWRLRRRLLETIELEPPCVRLPYVEAAESGKILSKACKAGWEGLIAKDPDAPYVERRSAAWVKLKCRNVQEFVIGGFTEPQRTRAGLGALLVGTYEEGRLQYAGKVGTGFSDRTLMALRKRLERRRQRVSPFADAPEPGIWVRPDTVCQVAFTEWTATGRLRHPVFLGLRDDKAAWEIEREV